MMKKAVSFRPIVDIRKFITENICDIPDKPNIELMQQNIRDYKRHEIAGAASAGKAGCAAANQQAVSGDEPSHRPLPDPEVSGTVGRKEAAQTEIDQRELNELNARRTLQM